MSYFCVKELTRFASRMSKFSESQGTSAAKLAFTTSFNPFVICSMWNALATAEPSSQITSVIYNWEKHTIFVLFQHIETPNIHFHSFCLKSRIIILRPPFYSPNPNMGIKGLLLISLSLTTFFLTKAATIKNSCTGTINSLSGKKL